MDIAERKEKTELGQLLSRFRQRKASWEYLCHTFGIKTSLLSAGGYTWFWAEPTCSHITSGSWCLSFLSPSHPGYGKHRNLVQTANMESPGELLLSPGRSFPLLKQLHGFLPHTSPSLPALCCLCPHCFLVLLNALSGILWLQRGNFSGVNDPSSSAGAAASGMPDSASVTAPYQSLLKRKKGCCGKEAVADERQLGKKEWEQHSWHPSPSLWPRNNEGWGRLEICDGVMLTLADSGHYPICPLQSFPWRNETASWDNGGL